MAEKEGFEPSEEVSSFGHLANDWFKPLTHLSKVMTIFLVVKEILSLPGVKYVTRII
tara:strand:- start:371 stop:541 length:171 start_codon:yes stop_codon:yes gene_type:complete